MTKVQICTLIKIPYLSNTVYEYVYLREVTYSATQPLSVMV